MASDFRVSVVTPVYNASAFLRRCVEAALLQPETAEMILVEDDSPDESLALCHQLASEDPRVRVIGHADGKNHGAAESRNLGIRSAKFEYTAFADADNFYLPGRFVRDREILTALGDVDGVYNAEGIHFYSDAAREGFISGGLGGGEFLSVSDSVPPEEFWLVMLGQHPRATVIGGLGIDGITLRSKSIPRIGYFDRCLRLQQDVHFYVRMSVMCRMAAGILDRPVAVRGVHEQMRSTDSRTMDGYRRQCWTSLREWFEANVTDPKQRLAFEKAFFHRSSFWRTSAASRAAFLSIVARHPKLLFETYGFFDLNLLDFFGRNWVTLHSVSAKQRLTRHFVSPQSEAANEA